MSLFIDNNIRSPKGSTVLPSSTTSSLQGSFSTLIPKDILERELANYEREKKYNDKENIPYLALRQMQMSLELYDHSLLFEFKKSVIANTIHKYQNRLFQHDIFQTISHYLHENKELSYDLFLTLRDLSPENIKKYFTAKVFLYLGPNLDAKISSDDFIKFMDKSIRVEEHLVKLLQYSYINENILYISGEQLQEYFIKEVIPLIDPLNEMDESFYEFYCCQTIQKLSYYLDNKNANRIPIRKLIHSQAMAELFSLIRLQVLLQEKYHFYQNRSNDSFNDNLTHGNRGLTPAPNPTQIEHGHEEINEIMDKVSYN